jgi:hypothetical protein
MYGEVQIKKNINRLPLSLRCQQTRKIYTFKYSIVSSLNFAHNLLKPTDLSASAIFSGHFFPQIIDHCYFYVFSQISNHQG